MLNDILPPKRGDGLDVPRRPSTPPAQVIEPTFRPPEIVAEETSPRNDDAIFASDSMLNFSLPSDDQRSKGSRLRTIKLSKKQSIIAATACAALIGGIGLTIALTRHKDAPVQQVVTPVPQKVETPAPAETVFTSQLTGIQVSEEDSKQAVTGVMIENSPDARPQSGLKDAGVVYEAIAEGGITRFLALYQEAEPDYIGPVRSARPYYVDWLRGYDAAIAHAGGSPEALALIKSAGVKDLDQFSNSGAYWRVSGRYAPHNLYTSIAKLRDLENSKGYTSSNFTGFVRKAAKPLDQRTANSIDLTMSGYLYNVHYDYNADTNSYKRSEGGRPHVDEKSSEQLSPKVVIALVVPYGLQSDGLHSDYKNIGSGKAYIFQDGGVTEGIWEKKDATSGIKLGDANGSPLAINAGQTWLTAVTGNEKVSYKP